MAALPLERFELFRSQDLDETREIVGRIFCEHRLDLAGRDHRLDARMHSHRLGQIVANFMWYGGDVYIEPGLLDTFYVVQIPLSGRSVVHCGNKEVYSTSAIGSVISPTEYLRQRWSPDCQQIIIRIERTALQAHLRDILGVPLWEPLVFEPEFRITDGPAASWVRWCHALIHELEQPEGLIFNEYVARQAEYTLMSGLLAAQRHNYSEFLEEKKLPVVPSRPVKTAREMIDAHPEWSHTVQSLAGYAHVSERTLQAGFNEVLQTGPKAYLTDVRMQRAHQELYAAAPGTTTVSTVARRLGLNHVGRFAAEYKRRFGELPSETLRR
ncbi:AraC family transcriptional regulator [Phytoactinopolyspora mesophila]|uniref:Helix-turn-helix domain-containing protein n=1 Tax=Phytoactinopolyspora mesophila TaxID=2650750 RepID=A0A7K3MCU9_9ACTN|nr:AraC family transcriptional regulator [Phytoactinopolyspora mesophila]NDL61084.1 helix-turn-helix domain-containing protein [Phytoactinopolyspora mesophila]